MKSLVFTLILSATVFAKEANIEGKDNKISVNWGPLIGYWAGDGHFPLRINYERYWKRNISFGGYLGTTLIEDSTELKVYEIEIGARKYFWGRFQRFSVGVLPFIHVRDYPYPLKAIDTAIPMLIGYTWQWSRIFTGIEAGFGPGFSTVYRDDEEGKSRYQTIADGALKIGVAF
jgi:hypothetical protein